MNKNRNYELQCLLELLVSVVNNESIPTWQREPDWGKLYKLADYHHVANVLYGPIISMNSKRLMKWKDSFEERFHYSVIMRERYQNSEKLLLAAFEKAKIHCMELEETVLNGCYERKELRYPVPLSFLVESGKEQAIRETMERIGFEEKPFKGRKPVPGEFCFYKPGGIHIILYEKMNFTGKKLSKYFALPPQPFQKKKGYQYIHVQDAGDFYLYYIAWMAERYARGATEVRDMMDLWKCYLVCYEKLDWREINKELKRMEIDWFGEMIVKLSAMWFGYVEDFGEDLELLLDMETYIISKGTQARKENEQLLPLVKEVADNYERDLKRERRKKLLQLWFPDRNYMETIYPVLERFGALLPLCWIGRLVKRQMKKVKYFALRRWAALKNTAAGSVQKIRSKASSLQKIKERFKKNKEDGNNT